MIIRAICILLLIAAQAGAFAPLIAEHRATPVAKPAEQSPVDCAFLPDGTLVYTCSRTSALYTLAPGSDRPLQLAVPGLGQPAGIFITDDSTIYIADAKKHQVLYLKPGQRGALHFGSFGHDGPHLCKPSDVCVADGMIAVADTGNSRVQLYSESGELIRSVGQWGSEEDSLVRPVGVAIHNGELFVCDEAMHRISVFDLDGTFKRTFASLGEQDGQLLRPTRIAFHNDQLFVTDSRNHRVQVFDPSTGQTIGRWGEHAIRPREHMGKLESPTGVAISPDGKTAALCEEIEGRVQLFDMIEPRDIPPLPGALGSTHFDKFMAGGPDTIVLSSPDLQAVEVYDLSGVPEGATPLLITRFGQQGWGFGKFVRIAGLAFDELNQFVYVTDSAQRRLSIWKLDREPDDEQRFVPTMARMVQTIDFTTLRETTEELQMLPTFAPGAAVICGGGVAVADERSGAILRFDPLLELADQFIPWRGQPDPPPQILQLRFGHETLYAVSPDRGPWIVQGDYQHGTAYAEPVVRADGVFAFLAGSCVSIDAGENAIVASGPGERDPDWRRGSDNQGGVALDSLFEPTDILAHADDLLSVLDYGNHRVIFLNAEGEPVSILGPRPFVMDAQAELKAKRRAAEAEGEQ